MTVIPEGMMTVTGCVPGDVIAFESGPNRVWRVADARSGTPSLVQIGQREPGGGASSIAFANGNLYGITGDALYKQFDPATFAVIGTPIDLSSVTTVGGLAFDGNSHWYVCTTTRLVHEDDPPTPAGWNVLFTGLQFSGHGLEVYEGELWAGAHQDAGYLAVGKFNMATSTFVEVWQINETPDGSNLGFVAFAPDVHPGDANCDDATDGTDIQAFVTAMLDPAGYVAAFPDCHVLNCDVNGDSAIDSSDVASFVQCLLNECP